MNAAMHVTVRSLTVLVITIQFRARILVADGFAAIALRLFILRELTESVAVGNSYMIPATNVQKLIPVPMVSRYKQNTIPVVCVQTAMQFAILLTAYMVSAMLAAVTGMCITAVAAAMPDIINYV